MPKPEKKKVMMQPSGALLEAANRKLLSLSLKRDAYLNELLTCEIQALEQEVTVANSQAVQTAIVERMLPSRTRLTIELDATLVARIDNVLKNRNIPRDSFLNRILFFLVAEKPILDTLQIKYQCKPGTNSIAINAGSSACPFEHIRAANAGRFYTQPYFSDHSFPPNIPNLFALNVAISVQDWQDTNVTDNVFLAALTKTAEDKIPTAETNKRISMADIFAAGALKRKP